MKKIVIRIAAVLVFGAALVIGAIGLGRIGHIGRNKPVDANYHSELFGENVYIFSPEDNADEVQEVIDRIYALQEENQFGDERYGIYFLPGEYDEDLHVNIGFYTQVAGLGKIPTDTSLGKMECLARWLGDDESNHNACCNFWRSVENLEFRNNSIWAVSQATDMRRVQMDKALFLHDDYGWCSGGFLADSKVISMVDSGSQQQWLSRNCDWGTWMGENWNMVFVGLQEGCTPTGTWPVRAYTDVATTDVIREKPFLIYDEARGYGVYIPRLREQSQGISWGEEDAVWIENQSEIDPKRDCILPIESFYIAKPNDSAAVINEELSKGKNLLLTPGVYLLDEPLLIEGENRICLGMGLATLRNTGGNSLMEISDESGIMVAGILFDAGPVPSEYLARVDGTGEEKVCPITLSDLYFRVGGVYKEESTQVDTCLLIDADHVVGDNFWIWRADHGDGVAWDKNVANTGILVNGDYVEIYALMVEHFEEYQTIWNGNFGRVFMYQSEIPYDVPDQEEWMSHDGNMPGYASFYVDEQVTDFQAYGLGVYLYNRDRAVTLNTAMEVPDGENVRVEHICTVMLNGYPGMNHIINDAGEAVDFAGDREILLYYQNGIYK